MKNREPGMHIASPALCVIRIYGELPLQALREIVDVGKVCCIEMLNNRIISIFAVQNLCINRKITIFAVQNSK